jgi:hypothetical protein
VCVVYGGNRQQNKGSKRTHYFLIEQRTHYSVLVRVIHRSRGKLACIVAGGVADTKTVEHLQNKQSIDQGKNRNLICRLYILFSFSFSCMASHVTSLAVLSFVHACMHMHSHIWPDRGKRAKATQARLETTLDKLSSGNE